MAILVVDDEKTTRSALREILTALGHQTILEAKNGEEALQVVGSEQNQIDMIISDWEMPYMDGLQLLERLTEMPATELIPFMLITSDLPDDMLKKLGQKYHRFDAHLIKPFQKAALERAMAVAFQHRQRIRSTVLVLSSEQSPDAPPSWKTVSDFQEFKKLAQAEGSRLAGVVIDPRLYKTGETWLTDFKKTFKQNLLVGCLETDPNLISGDLMANALFFSKSPAQLHAKMSARQMNSWDIERLIQLARTAQQTGATPAAKRSAEQILKIDPENSEALVLLAELDSNAAAATKNFERAVEISPFSANANLKLLKHLLKNKMTAETKACGDKIVTNFHQNPEVLCAAAAIYPSVEFLKKALGFNPNHPGLTSILNSAQNF